MSLEPRARERIAFIAASILLAGGAAYLLHDAWRSFRMRSLSEPSTCRVLASRYDTQLGSDSRDARPYEVVVRFVHEHGGQRYEREDVPGEFASSHEAQQIVSRYAPGADVPCLYARGDPGLVGLRAREQNEWVTSFAIGLTLLSIPLFVLGYDRIKRRGGRRGRR